MSEKRKSRSSVAVLERVSIGLANYTGQQNINTAQGYIASYLQPGEENARPASVLAQMIGLSCTRELRREIERERINGVLILSSDSGYYLPSENDLQAAAEIAAFAHRYDARLKANRAASKAARDWLKSRSTIEQVSLFNGDEI